MRIVLMTLACSTLVGACGSRDLDPGTEIVANQPIAREAQPAPPNPDRVLHETQDRIAGFPLPDGLTLRVTDGDRRVYHTLSSVRALRAYVAGHVIPQEVMPLGPRGVRYANAIARGSNSGEKLSITISEVIDGTRFEVEFIPRPPEHAVPEAELQRRALQQLE